MADEQARQTIFETQQTLANVQISIICRQNQFDHRITALESRVAQIVAGFEKYVEDRLSYIEKYMVANTAAVNSVIEMLNVLIQKEVKERSPD
jgi:hypothetical protein